MDKKFIKNGRVYWIIPKPIPGQEKKERPAIALFKYGFDRHVFLQLGTGKNNIPSDLFVTNLLRTDKLFSISSLKNSIIHLDISKPENKNNALLKPHISENLYLDIDINIMKKIRNIYYKRREEIKNIRIIKAKIFAIQGNEIACKKQLQMLKDLEPIKNKNMNIDALYEKFKKI